MVTFSPLRCVLASATTFPYSHFETPGGQAVGNMRSCWGVVDGHALMHTGKCVAACTVEVQVGHNDNACAIITSVCALGADSTVPVGYSTTVHADAHGL